MCKKYVSKDLRKYFKFIEKEVEETTLWYNDYLQAKSRYIQFSSQDVKNEQDAIAMNKALNSLITLIEDLSITDLKTKNGLNNILRDSREVNRKIENYSNKIDLLRKDVLMLFDAMGKRKFTLSESEAILKKHNIENLYKEDDSLFNDLHSYVYDEKNKRLYYESIELADLLEYADESLHNFLWLIRFHLKFKSLVAFYSIGSNNVFDSVDKIRVRIRRKYSVRSPFEFYGLIKTYL